MDLTTHYMGLELTHPIVASASPLSKDIIGMQRLENAGAAAIVMYSLFEEQIQQEATALENLMTAGADSFAESLSYFPDPDQYHSGTDQYLELIHRARKQLHIPIIASLNGISNTGWVDHARLMQDAGAHAIELNVYYLPTDSSLSGQMMEQRYIDTVRAVKSVVRIPVALKISPYFSSVGHMAHQLDEAGADALVLFNRFYQPDFDIDRLMLQTDLQLSEAHEIRLPLLWLAVLHGRLNASLGATTGVQTAVEVVKYLLAGADVVMTTSSLLRNDPEHLGVLRDGLVEWMRDKQYESVSEMRGAMSQQRVANPELLDRANYIRTISGYDGNT
ncbi:MAG: dihydroorotate dehydrogenase-like protein [Granulosicoccus sp.]|nr:dihydroorotate dehydrogenase-like protein [Granulosicoccus sp.]